MEIKYPHLFAPLEVRGRILKNRIMRMVPQLPPSLQGLDVFNVRCVEWKRRRQLKTFKSFRQQGKNLSQQQLLQRCTRLNRNG